MTGSDISMRPLIIASIIAAALDRPGMVSGGAGEVVKGVGSIVCGSPSGGGGSKGGGGSVGLIGPSGAWGPLLGRYGPDEGPVLNLLNCLPGIHGGTYPGPGGAGQVGEPDVDRAGNGQSQLINLCHRLGSSPDGSLKLFTPLRT